MEWGVLDMNMSVKELEDVQTVLRNMEVADKKHVERADTRVISAHSNTTAAKYYM